MSKIYRIDDVTAKKTKMMPPTLHVDASGMTTTSGWTGGALTEVVYITPPADGIQDFGFVADPPTGIVLQVLTPIRASWSGECAAWVTGVRVTSETNAVEASA